MLIKVKTFLFKGWLIETIFLITVTVIITITITYVADSLYKVSFGKKTFSTGKLALENTNGSNSTVNTNTNTTQNNSSSTGTNTVPPTTTPPPPTSGTQTNQPPPATPPPAASPPPAAPPPAAPSGCFVTVNGYLYNMQSAIGAVLTDPNTSKKRTHTSGNFHCGSFNAPTNMTSTYLSKHNGMGCAQRLAPYIYTPPAPTDPSC